MQDDISDMNKRIIADLLAGNGQNTLIIGAFKVEKEGSPDYC